MPCRAVRAGSIRACLCTAIGGISRRNGLAGIAVVQVRASDALAVDRVSRTFGCRTIVYSTRARLRRLPVAAGDCKHTHACGERDPGGRG